MEEVKKLVEMLITSNNKFMKTVDEEHTQISLEFCNTTLEMILKCIKENE